METNIQSSTEYRIANVLSCSYNKLIPRVENAGQIVSLDDKQIQIMHNGLKIFKGSYYGDELITPMLEKNRGVHEPEEEWHFMQALKSVPENGTMIELGSYWAFYSMWFAKEIKNGKTYMIEKVKSRLKSGKRNFLLNGLVGEFAIGNIGSQKINFKVDKFVKSKKIETIHILHADIQKKELVMLNGANESLKKGIIKQIFVSTHSQKLHYNCLKKLKKHNYDIVYQKDKKETKCHDGIIVAKLG